MFSQHDMAYVDFKDLARRTASDKVLREKAFNTAKTPKYDGYQRGFVFLDKSSEGSGVANNEMKQNLQLSTNQLLGTLKKEQFIQNLNTIFWVLI